MTGGTEMPSLTRESKQVFVATIEDKIKLYKA